MQAMIHVREANAKDDERVGELLVEAFVTAYAAKMPEVVVSEERKRSLRDVASKRQRATVFVAELDGRVVGTVMIVRPGARDSEAWLEGYADLRQLAVDVSLQGQGLSKALLDHAERVVREEWRCPGMCLHVRRGAFGVARLYEGRGFLRVPEGDLPLPDVYLEGYVLRFQK